MSFVETGEFVPWLVLSQPPVNFELFATTEEKLKQLRHLRQLWR